MRSVLFLSLIAGCLSLPPAAGADTIALDPSANACTLQITLPLDRITQAASEAAQGAQDTEAVQTTTPAGSGEKATQTDLSVPLLPASPTRGLAYATQGSTAWWFEVSLASNFNHGDALMGGLGVEWYPVDGFALGLRADGIGVSLQDTPRTGGAGVSILLRWHAVQREGWSLYFDGGCGVAWFTDPVPAGAAQLDFTPELGFGCSIELDDDVRLLTGVRWFHISNGQTAQRNPGVDMLSAYVGLTMPF